MDLAELSSRLANLIRLGTVLEVNHGAERCRFKSGRLETDWLRWVTLRAGETKEWNPPTVGEQAVLLSPSGVTENGVVLVGIFSDAAPSPSHSPDEHVRTYPDGARIAYDHASGALTVTGIKTALVEATQLVTVDCPSTIFTGDVLIKGNLTVDMNTLAKGLLTYLAGMAGDGGEGGKTVIRGPITHQGSYDHQGTWHHGGGSIISDQVVQDGHLHHDSMGGLVSPPQ